MEESRTKREARRIIKREIPKKWKLPLITLLSLLSGLGLMLASILITRQSVFTTLRWITGRPLVTFSTMLFLGLIILFLALVTRSLFAGGLTVSLLVLIASYINYFKNLITSTPLKLSDFSLITQLGPIMEMNSSSISFSRNSILAAVAVALWLVVLFIMSRPLRTDWRPRLITAGAAAVLFVVLFGIWSFADAWLFKPLRAPVQSNYTQAFIVDKTGVSLGLWRSVIRPSAKEAAIELSSSELEEAKGFINEIDPGGDSGVKPNVIVVLSESFFDVTELPGVSYEDDPLADFHAAMETGVSGTFYTRTLGYGTCSIEMELLTGINTRYLSSDQLLSEWTPEDFERLNTAPRLFQQNGYYTAYLHTFNDTIYNRTPTYTHLGFNDLYFSGDFAAVDPDAAAAAEDYWSYMFERISGGAYSDAYMAELLINLYERENDNGPVFLYGVTMENHTPFEPDKYENYDYPFTANISEEASGKLNALTQGVANSSKLLGRLIEYFSECDEPTIIVFYGDHRPGLPLEEGGSLYSALGLCAEDNSDWSVEEIAELYSTSYVMWSNDESLLPAPAGTKGLDSSSNFLGLDILRAADIELDNFWRMVAAAKESCTILAWEYFVSKSGGVYEMYQDCLTGLELRRIEVMSRLMRYTFYRSDSVPVFYTLN